SPPHWAAAPGCGRGSKSRWLLAAGGASRSVQAKTVGPREGAPIGALRASILAHLVFRPAVKIGHTEAVDATLALQGLFAIAANVVGLDGFPDLAILEVVAVDRRRHRQAHTEARGTRRPAKGQAADREHMRGQSQQLGDLGGVIADGADGSAAK